MTPEDLRAFAHRDWSAVAERKRTFWLELTHQHGPLAALRAADALRVHAAKFMTDAAQLEARGEDLAHHLRLKQRIDAARSAFRR